MVDSNHHSADNNHHYSVDEILVWLAGKGSPEKRTAIAEHLSHCEMCHDTMEGLLHYEAPEGIKANENRMYQDFRSKVMLDEKKSNKISWIGNMSTVNLLLVFLAFILFAVIIGALFMLIPSSNNEQSAENTPNRVDSAYQYKMATEDEEKYPAYTPDSTVRDRELEAILRADKNVNYDYYDDSDPSPSKTPYYDYYTPSDPLVYTIKKIKNDDITSYKSKNGASLDRQTTPQDRYFGYDKYEANPRAEYNGRNSKTRIGDMLIDIPAIITDAKAYEASGQYYDGIKELEKYESLLPEPVADIDYWLARLYVKNGDTQKAVTLLKRLAGYDNPYQSTAQDWLNKYN